MGIRHKKITNIPDLIAALETATFKEYAFLASLLELDPKELYNYVSFSEEKYTRHCIVRTEDYELLALGWEAGQATPVHSHAEQECWVHIVEGEFEEKIFQFNNNKLEQLTERSSAQSNTSYMHDDLGYHSLQNISDGRAISLHLYVKPIKQCLVFDDVLNAFVMQELCDDNVVTV